MSKGVKFVNEKKAKEFRKYLEERKGHTCSHHKIGNGWHVKIRKKGKFKSLTRQERIMGLRSRKVK